MSQQTASLVGTTITSPPDPSTGTPENANPNIGSVPNLDNPIQPQTPDTSDPTPNNNDQKSNLSGLQRLDQIYQELRKEYPDVKDIDYQELSKFVQEHKLCDNHYLYLCARIAHDDSSFNRNGSTTWCNAFAARVYNLYTGKTDLSDKTVADQLKTIKSGGTYLGNLNSGGIAAQNAANKGNFVIAISTDPDEHIAVIMPGKGVINGDGIYCPSVAQQGNSNLLYAYTDKGTLNFAWKITEDNKKGYNIQYYQF